MKKAEELKLYAPEPKRPELDAALCMSVAESCGSFSGITGRGSFVGTRIRKRANFRRVKLRSDLASV